MYLMRIGKRSQERPVARLNDTGYVDLREEVGDFDEKFFADGLASAATLVQKKAGRGLGTQTQRMVRFDSEDGLQR